MADAGPLTRRHTFSMASARPGRGSGVQGDAGVVQGSSWAQGSAALARELSNDVGSNGRTARSGSGQWSRGRDGTKRRNGTARRTRRGRVKRSTRLHEALAFLSSISMASERAAAKPGGGGGAGAGSSESEDSHMLVTQGNAVSIRLRGRKDFEYVSVSDRRCRYSHMSEQRFRHALLQADVLGNRVFFSASKGYPTGITSVIPYDAQSENVRNQPKFTYKVGRGDWLASKGRSQPAWHRWKGRSYAQHLHATWGPCRQARDDRDPLPFEYDPNHIDDPEIQANQDKQVVSMVGYRLSILPFVRESELKDRLNAKFRLKHEWIPPELTLSKIRNLKRLVLELWVRLDLDVATIALAHVCFEKLIYLDSVTKANRRLLMGVCVLLAHKFTASGKVAHLLVELERTLRVSRKQLLKAEFKVFARLGFALFVPPYEYDAHFQRLLRSMEVNELDYLGPKAFETYASIVRGAPDSVASTGGDSAFSDDALRDRAFAYDADADGGDSSSVAAGAAVEDGAGDADADGGDSSSVAAGAADEAGDANTDGGDSDAEGRTARDTDNAHVAPVPTPPLAAAAAELVESEG